MESVSTRFSEGSEGAFLLRDYHESLCGEVLLRDSG